MTSDMQRKQSSMQSVKSILERFNPREDKYVSREFQPFGLMLAEKLGDMKRKSMYIKFAKTLPRPALEQALRFVIDSNARNKAALFMWKLKELGIMGNKESEKRKKKSEK